MSNKKSTVDTISLLQNLLAIVPPTGPQRFCPLRAQMQLPITVVLSAVVCPSITKTICRGIVSNNSETSPIALQMIDLTLKVARNKEENHAVHDASINLLSSLLNAGVFVENDDLLSVISYCQEMRWEQMKAAHKNLLEEKKNQWLVSPRILDRRQQC